ncbi:hypothetical protein G4B88_031377 [Cannabis sativa]|uniref:Uncharacterized protein n=1 Tax=Cannabis sativa TaxID=3483 RepID=A0A7J6F602_CANSA|nr:hypothetical protein G4B88_031377 [Cannabis sativa]
MAIIVHAKKLLKKKTSNNSSSVPKGCCAVYVGDEVQKKRFVIPVSYLNHHEFRALLSKAVEEYGYSHPMGGLTIPCSEHIFLTLTSRLGSNKNHQRMSTKQNPNEDYQFGNVVNPKQLLRMKIALNNNIVPKGCCAVYVGDEVQKKRFVIPVSYLNHHEFRALLSKAVEEYGYSHPMGGLTIPCPEDTFVNLTSRLSG